MGDRMTPQRLNMIREGAKNHFHPKSAAAMVELAWNSRLELLDELDALRAERDSLREALTVFTNAELYGYKTAKVARAALTPKEKP